MCNGVKIPFEQRMKQKTPKKFMECCRSITPSNGNDKKNNSSTLDPIQENQLNGGYQNQSAFQKSQEILNKSLQHQNSTSSIKGQTPKKEGTQNSSFHNQSILKQGSAKSKDKFNLNDSTILNGSITSNNKYEQTPDKNKRISFMQNKSVTLPFKKERSLSNKSLLNQNARLSGDQQKENSYHILINDGENFSQSNLTQQQSFEDLRQSKNSTIKIKPINSPTCQIEKEKNYSVCYSNKNRSAFLKEQGLFSQRNQIQANKDKLNQSLNFSEKKNFNGVIQKNSQNEDLSQSPTRNKLNLSYKIRSPQLSHSPLKKSHINYTMTIQNLKAERDLIANSSQFEILNRQCTPLKDINNQNEVQYGQSLKYIINLLRKEDPQFLQPVQITQLNKQLSDKKSYKSPVKRK